MTQPVASTITVAGNVEGSIVVGDNNFVVNTNYGTIIQQQAAPRVQRREAIPQPPRSPRGFVGRAQELAQLEAWIAAGEPVFVDGFVGLGKTSLVKKASNGPAANAQPGGVLFLEGVDQDGTALGFGDLVQLMFRAAYDAQPELKVDLASARTYLSNLRPLVLLSGVSLTGANLESLADLFPNAPILVDAEAAPEGDVFTAFELGPLAREDSIALLAARARLGDGSSAQPLLDQIAALLNDTPAALLAIGSAVSAKRLTLAEALTRLGEITTSSTSPTAAGEDRAYLTVLSTLNSDERTMLVTTGAAPGVSVDRKWLEKVSGGEPVSQVLEGLGLLQANSPRLRLIPGFKGLLGAGPDFEAEANVARGRLLEHLQAELQLKSPDFEFVRDELGNLLGLFKWTVEQRRWASALALARGLDPFVTLRGLWDGWGTVLLGARDAAESLGDIPAQAWALHQLGTREFGLGDLASAQAHLQQARDLRLSLGDEIGAAYSQHNLDVLAAKSPPPAQTPPRARRGRLPWFLGGIALLILLALIFGIARGLHLPGGAARRPASTPLSAPAATATGPMPTFTAPATVTPSLTLTPTVSPTPTMTLTPTVTPTETLTPMPSFVPLLSAVMLEHAYCFYGPGRVYLFYSGLNGGVKVEATGRNDDGSWIYVQYPSSNDPGKMSRCWFAADSLSLAGDPVELEPVYPDKVGPPISGNPVNYPHLKDVKAVRNGDNVTISWDRFVIPPGDREENVPLYLLELWTCSNGDIVFSPHGLNTESFTVSDPGGCLEPSHARVFLAEVHGYIGPEQIPWP